MCESSSNEDIDKETLKDALIDGDVTSRVSPTFPFLSCLLISTLSRCHPGLVPLLSCPIRIFSITSPTSSNWEKTAQCLQSCSRGPQGRSNLNLHTHLHDEHVLSSPLKVQTSLSLVDTQGFLLGAHSFRSVQSYEHISVCSRTKHIAGEDLDLIGHDWESEGNMTIQRGKKRISTGLTLMGSVMKTLNIVQKI